MPRSMKSGRMRRTGPNSWRTTFGRKGRVTIPKQVRHDLGIKTDDRLRCEGYSDGVIVLTTKRGQQIEIRKVAA